MYRYYCIKCIVFTFILCLSAILVGCGGGGGSSSNPAGPNNGSTVVASENEIKSNIVGFWSGNSTFIVDDIPALKNFTMSNYRYAFMPDNTVYTYATLKGPYNGGLANAYYNGVGKYEIGSGFINLKSVKVNITIDAPGSSEDVETTQDIGDIQLKITSIDINRMYLTDWVNNSNTYFDKEYKLASKDEIKTNIVGTWVANGSSLSDDYSIISASMTIKLDGILENYERGMIDGAYFTGNTTGTYSIENGIIKTYGLQVTTVFDIAPSSPQTVSIGDGFGIVKSISSTRLILAADDGSDEIWNKQS